MIDQVVDVSSWEAYLRLGKVEAVESLTDLHNLCLTTLLDVVG